MSAWQNILGRFRQRVAAARIEGGRNSDTRLEKVGPRMGVESQQISRTNELWSAGPSQIAALGFEAPVVRTADDAIQTVNDELGAIRTHKKSRQSFTAFLQTCANVQSDLANAGIQTNMPFANMARAANPDASRGMTLIDVIKPKDSGLPQRVKANQINDAINAYNPQPARRNFFRER